ncbi:HlyD family secretion protein [Vulcanococcus limneticus Candia 3F8]|uniref:HlyD family secretion protein n=1 Tax=Vulcanococcus limneticus TaxID=2170428 RepID=UPI0018E36877|nr:HlyD family secretion protein [Vulcanococcus limneticus]MCP9793076.1 HlyD family secretion protein [Vulcanococcus limneticus MW73D5]MCP9895038.1 HlyD family secretion protein [Vulcanococcus limneticus Candia 3F8]MCP9898462.1 HlyD family secretion protein [Vulcanococcus limneticus Candia 3B3]
MRPAGLQQDDRPKPAVRRLGRVQLAGFRPGKASATAAVIVALGGGAIWLGANWGVEQTDNAQLQAHLHRISSRIPGSVAQVLVEAHQAVRPGQPLLRLDPRDQRMALAKAEADLVAARRKADAALVTVSADRSDALASAEQAQGAQLEARAELQRTASDLRRVESLYRQGAASQQQVELTRSQVQQALGRVSRSSGNRASAQADTATIQVDRSKAAAARAEVLQAEAALAAVRLQLAYTTVTAPGAAVVGQRDVEVGQGVLPGQGLMTLVGEQVWVEANFKETQVARMQVRDRAEVRFDGLPGVAFRGVVSSLAPASGSRFALLPPDNATGNFTKVVQRVTVRIELEPEQVRPFRSRLRPGLSATVRVHT